MVRLLPIVTVLLFALAYPRIALMLAVLVTAGTVVIVRHLLGSRTVYRLAGPGDRMPEFIKPRRAVIETAGEDWLGIILAIVAVALVIAAVVAFVVAHAVLLACCLAVFVAVIVGLPVAWRIRYREREPLPLPATAGRQLASQRAALDAPPLALPSARQALPAATHLHIHFHGVSPDDAAEIISRREIQ